MESLGVKQGGRLVPIRSFAEAFVRDVHGSEPMRLADGQEVDSLKVLLECVLYPERAMEWCTVGSDTPGGLRIAGEALEELAFGVPQADARQISEYAILEARLSLMVFASDELLLLPRDQQLWGSMASIRGEPLEAQRDRLIASWRSTDVPTIQSALDDFASSVAELQRTAGVQRWTLRLERFWESVPVLSMSVVGYFIAAVLASFGTRRAAMIFAMAGLSVHLGGVMIRALVLDRLPVQNHYESMAVVAAMVALGAVLVNRRQTHQAVLGIGTLLAALMLGAAEWLDMPGRVLELEAGILSSTAILKYHVLTILAGYSLILLGSGVGAAVVFRRLRGATLDELSGLHRLQTSIGFWVFWVLGLGILLGAVWADRAWGRWWAFDPKETWALITWMVYLAMVHIPASKLPAHRRPVAVGLMHVLGLLAMLWTYFGVNLLIPSLHSYA